MASVKIIIPVLVKYIYHSKYIKRKEKKYTSIFGGRRWRSWLRLCATSRKVAGSIPDGVIEIFH
jgi:hypothetical protein